MCVNTTTSGHYMKYWKRFKLDGWEKGRDEISDWLDSTDLVQTGLFWNPVNIQELQQAAPTIFKLLENRGAVALYSAIIIAAHLPVHPFAGIHIDDDVAQARLQIPIRNTIGTYTHFFSHDESKIGIRHLPNGHRYFELPYTACKYQSRVCVDRPTILRTSAAHAVDTRNSVLVPRITLTLGLLEDPVIFL